MSLDPKYADLPWIAHGQPDVYEAGQLPEADQNIFDQREEAIMPKEIESIKLSVSDAHKRFEKCKLDASKVDFSDSISGCGKVGYAIDTDEYDLLPPESRNSETLTKRFQRLQTEIHELISDAAAVSDQTTAETKDPITPAQLASLAESLRDQLQELQLCNMDTSAILGTSDAMGKTLQSQILKQIDEFKPDKPTSRKPEKSSHLIYEIYDRQSVSKQSDAEKLLDISRRIQRLEALIGQPDPTRLSALTADTVQHGLMEACSRLAARSSIFQPGHLDMIETRLTGLQTKLQAVTEKREVIADFDAQNKIADLYELVKKWNDVADSLPMIADRLAELKTLHEEASQFSQSLSSIETSQKNVEDNLKTYTKILGEVQQNICQNIQVVKDNFTALESRFSQPSTK